MAARVDQVADLELTVHDVSPQALDAAEGIGRRADMLDDAVRGADIVLTMVAADAHVLNLGEALKPLVKPGAVVADFSTVHPDTITALDNLLGPGVHVVSASCMKSVAAAISGTLTVFVGGDSEQIARLAPVLDAIATHWVDVDSPAAAKTLKLVNNQAVAGLNLVIAEAMVAGARGGISYREVVDHLSAIDAGGWALANHVIKHTMRDDLGPGYFSARYMHKDVALAARLAADRNVARFLAGPIMAALRGADAIGHGNDYHPVIIRWLERGAGADTPPATGDPALLATLGAWVAAGEKLIAIHGLLLAQAAGAAVELAAQRLESASASSGMLRRLLADGFPVDWWRPTDADMAAIAAIRDVAAALPVPLSAAETTYDYALALRHQTAAAPLPKEPA
jgi:3-hydroxyisobutyrate dehydrogenase-like beta-hydroxyacid dehydrogenase